MKLMNSIITIALGLLLLVPSGAIAQDTEEEKILAIKRAYFFKTGTYWENASLASQEKFLKYFDRLERTRLRQEYQRERRLLREEAADAREDKMERRQIANMERRLLRQKMIEERKIAQEKRERDRKMAEMKKKIQQQRRKR